MNLIIEVETNISYIQREKQELRMSDCMLYPTFKTYYSMLSKEERRLRALLKELSDG